MATKYPTESDIVQASAYTDFASDNKGIAARLTRACVDSLAHLFLSAQHHSASKHLRRSLGILRLWSRGHGACDGRLDDLLETSKELRRTTLSVLNALRKLLKSGNMPPCEAEILVGRKQPIRVESELKFWGNGIHKYTKSDNSTTMQLQDQNTQRYSETRWLSKEPDGNVTDSDSDGYSSSDGDNSIPENKNGGLSRFAEDVKMQVQCLSDLSSTLDFPAVDPEPTDEPSVLSLDVSLSDN